jgi:hypothetical protein
LRGFAALIDFQKNNLGALIAGVETPAYRYGRIKEPEGPCSLRGDFFRRG